MLSLSFINSFFCEFSHWLKHTVWNPSVLAIMLKHQSTYHFPMYRAGVFTSLSIHYDIRKLCDIVSEWIYARAPAQAWRGISLWPGLPSFTNDIPLLISLPTLTQLNEIPLLSQVFVGWEHRVVKCEVSEDDFSQTEDSRSMRLRWRLEQWNTPEMWTSSWDYCTIIGFWLRKGVGVPVMGWQSHFLSLWQKAAWLLTWNTMGLHVCIAFHCSHLYIAN